MLTCIVDGDHLLDVGRALPGLEMVSCGYTLFDIISQQFKPIIEMAWLLSAGLWPL